MKDEDKIKQEGVIHTQVAPNFLYPEIKATTFSFGAKDLPRVVLRSDGNWRDFVPEGETQYHNINGTGFDNSACYISGQQHSLETLMEEQYDLPNKNYSPRFNAYLSDGTPSGGDPIKGADSMRNDGLVDEGIMPFNETIISWNDYHSFKGVNEAECRLLGKMWLKEWRPQYEVVFERGETLTSKYTKLKEALTLGTVAISVSAWWQRGDVYIKPEGVRDNHLVQCVDIDDEGYPWVWDTYEPYLKKLDKTFDFEFGLRWNLEKLTPPAPPLPENPNWLTDILKNLLDVLKDLSSWITTQKEVPPTDPTSPVLNIIEPTFNPPDRLQEFCKAIESFEGYYKGSRSERNRNPGNCRFSPIGYLSIYEPVKRDKDNFAIFPTYELGFLYLKNLVKHKCQKHPDWTILQFFQEFAPSSDNNDPIHYAETVASNCGLLATNKLKDVVQLKGLLGNQSNMPSTSVVAIVVNLLVTLLPYIGVKVDGGSIDTTIQTLTAIVTGIWLWVQNRRLNTALAGTGKEVTLGGLKA